MEDLLKSYKLNKKIIEVVSLTAPTNDDAYWATQSISARLRAVELMRQINYGINATSGRLQRVLEIAQREPR